MSYQIRQNSAPARKFRAPGEKPDAIRLFELFTPRHGWLDGKTPAPAAQQAEALAERDVAAPSRQSAGPS